MFFTWKILGCQILFFNILHHQRHNPHILPRSNPIHSAALPWLNRGSSIECSAAIRFLRSLLSALLTNLAPKKQLFWKKSFLNRANLLWRSKHQKKTKIRRSRMNAKMDTALCSSSFSAWLNPYSAESNVFSQYFPKKFG